MGTTAHNADDGERNVWGTQAIERALRLLVMVADGARTTQEIAATARLPRSTVLRLLQALERRRFAARRADGTWALGPAIAELAARVDMRWTLAEAARPRLGALVDEFQETAVVCVREGLESVCVEKLESGRSMRFTVSIGTRTPLHAGATARTLLAFAPPAIVEEVVSRSLKAYTQQTITSPDELRTVLARIHRLGYGYGESEIDVGAFAVAAPVRDGAGVVVAALAVAGPLARMTPALRKALVSAIVQASDSISEDLSSPSYRGEMEGR